MPDQTEDIAPFVDAYIRRSQPIHWVNWMARCNDSRAKEGMQTVLFRGGELRDLTDSDVREQVLEVICATPAVLELVLDDLAEEVGALEMGEQAPPPK